jgi:hypothetical protein
MSLKVELKPNERLIIGTAVIRNGDQRTRFFIEGDAPILREKDILTVDSADTPAKKNLPGRSVNVHSTGFVQAQPNLLSTSPGFLVGCAKLFAADCRGQ